MGQTDYIAKETTKKLERVAEKIIEAKKDLRIGTKSLTPLNYKEEMEKFFKSKTYNPKFKYKKQSLPKYDNTIDSLKKEIDSLKFPEDLKEHILNLLDDQKKLYLTKKSIGKKGFSKNAHSLFDWGSDRLDLLLANTPNVPFRIYEHHITRNAMQIKKQFEEVLAKYHLTDYKIKIDPISTHIISAGYKSVKVGNKIVRYDCNVKRLIVHEIESHILQTQNIKNAKTPLVELSSYGNQNLYSEGLAVYNEIATRKITPSAFEMYYYRIKAVRMINKSFREIYNSLIDPLRPKRAYVMTYRVKRGMSDTSEPGGFPKDASYLLGFHEIENLVNEGFPRKHLYLTKSPVLTTILLKYGIIDDKKVITPGFFR